MKKGSVWFPDVIFDRGGWAPRKRSKIANRFLGTHYPQTNAVELTQGTRLEKPYSHNGAFYKLKQIRRYILRAVTSQHGYCKCNAELFA